MSIKHVAHCHGMHFPLFVNYQNFGDDRTIVTSKCAIKNIETYLNFSSLHLFFLTIFLSRHSHYTSYLTCHKILYICAPILILILILIIIIIIIIIIINNNTTNVEPKIYDYTNNNLSHWNSNEKLKEKFGSCTRETPDRFITKGSYTWNITYNTESNAVRSLKPERWGSPLVQEKYQEEKTCDKRRR